MKRILLILFSFVSVCSYSQINRTVYGIPLLTSVSKAKQILTNKGLKCTEGQAEFGMTVICKGEIFFANKRWEAIILAVKDNNVYSIGFMMYGESEKIGETYMSLGNVLKEKYGNFAQTPTTNETYNSIKVSINFDDTHTLLFAQCEINQLEESVIILSYTDKEMYNRFQQKGKDEL